MKGADSRRDIDDDLWNDIEAICQKDLSYSLNFQVPLASGFRFRYQSEIDKKSYSSLKGAKNLPPLIKISSCSEVTLRLDLVTEESTVDNALPHFYSLYEVSKLTTSRITDGACCIDIKKGEQDIKLEFLGIRKWKLKEAIPKIKELYPHYTESEVKKFFYLNKETVKLRALLFNAEYIITSIFSKTIKSQIAKENKFIKIQHFSPKTVADNNEKLIIVLEKKITGESKTYLMFENVTPSELKPTYDDGQTFVFNVPYIQNFLNPISGKIRIQCSDTYDEKPILFVPFISESRKRKFHQEIDVPLKRPTNYDNPRRLYPESGNADSTVEVDGSQDMDIAESLNDEKMEDSIEYDEHLTLSSVNFVNPMITEEYHNVVDSCKDSGFHSDNKSSTSSDFDSDDEIIHESDDDSDQIEVEGRRRRNRKVLNLEPINFPSTKRAMDSRLIPNRKDQVADKIFSEIARIGHDFAFGKEPSDLFTRIEKHLPVVFTLQDDVGDTPLNNAILKGNTKQAERILKTVQEECKWALDMVNTSGHTALILAPACDVPYTFITKLLDAGCQLNIYDDLGKSAIIYAIEYKNTDALKVLLQYIKKYNITSLLRRKDIIYFSPLQIAVMNSYFDGVNMLLSLTDLNGNYLVDVNELSLMNEETALTIAVERNIEIGIIRLLLDRPDLNINHKNDRKCTALHQASKMKAYEVIGLLKEHFAVDVSEVADTDEDSDDDMNKDEVTASYSPGEVSPVITMSLENGNSTSNIVNLTTKMESMSLKGTYKIKLIDLLINGKVFLTVDELRQIIRPNFKTLLTKYDDSSEYKKEISNVFERFNCLPNSLGQLFDKLREINRVDVIHKVVEHFT